MLCKFYDAIQIAAAKTLGFTHLPAYNHNNTFTVNIAVV